MTDTSAEQGGPHFAPTLGRLNRTVLVLDGTELHRDWFLRGPDFRLLGYYAREHGLAVGVPEPVVVETIANYGRAYAELQRKLKALERDARLLRVGPIGQPSSSAYPAALAQSLAALGFDVLPWPTVEHENLVGRAAARTPPFDASGSGYRDTLTWLTALDAGNEGRTVVFVSNDRDFQGAKGQLAAELADEAEGNGVTVELFKTVGAWLAAMGLGALGVRDAAADGRDEQLFKYLLESDFLTEMWLPTEQLGFPPNVTVDDTIMEVDFDSWWRAADVVQREDRVIVGYDLFVSAVVPAFVTAADADLNRWAHGEPGWDGRVYVEPVIPFTIRLEAAYTGHDILDDLTISEVRTSLVFADRFGYPSAQLPGQLELELDGAPIV